MRRLVWVLGALVGLLGAGYGEAAARKGSAAQTSLAAALSRGMKQIGGSSGALVVDLTTKQILFARAPEISRMPASVEKVYTTSTALLRFGPNATLTTAVRGMGSINSQGAWRGTLYLVGGGDPTFGSTPFDRAAYGTGATVQRLVKNLIAATGIRALHGHVVGDATYFDSLRGTPPTGYRADLPDIAGELSALAYDRGFANFAGTQAQRRPDRYATRQFLTALRSAGVAVPQTTPVSLGRTPAAARTLATVSSPRMARLIQLTNTPSDNFLAEMLLKGIGARFGGAGSTAAGAAVVRSTVQAAFGVRPRLSDGSGLSRADATTPQQVVALLARMSSNPVFTGSLAIAGRTGTLKDYSHGTAAQGNCLGKTGTLHDVANLVGYCHARDGHTLVFAFLANGISDPLSVHAVEADQMAPALAGYDG